MLNVHLAYIRNNINHLTLAYVRECKVRYDTRNTRRRREREEERKQEKDEEEDGTKKKKKRKRKKRRRKEKGGVSRALEGGGRGARFDISGHGIGDLGSAGSRGVGRAS